MDLGSERRRLFKGAKKLRGFCSLNVFHFLVIEEADCGASPYYPGAVVLYSNTGQHYSR